MMGSEIFKGITKIFRIAIMLLLLLSVFISNPVKAQEIVPDGPFQVRVEISSITPSPSFIAQTVTIQVRAETIDPTGGIPTGIVELKSGSDKVCEITLNASGVGSCNLVFPTPENIPFQAFYLGNDTFLPAASTVLQHEILNKFTPLVQITADVPDPSIILRDVQTSIAVSSAYSTSPGGTVDVYRSLSGTCSAAESLTAVDSCSLTLDAAGEGSCLINLSQDGTVQLCVVYDGDTPHFPAVSAPVPHQVSISNSFVNIDSVTPGSAVLNEPVVFQFSASSPDGTPQNGLVTIYQSGNLLCSAAVSVGQCSAVFNIPNENTIYAAYAGEMDGLVLLQPSISNPQTVYVKASPNKITADTNKIPTYRDYQKSVATLSATDPNDGDTFTFSLITTGTGNHNDQFQIVGDRLVALGNLDGENGFVYLDIMATDQTGLFYEERLSFTLIDNLPELPDTGYALNRSTAVFMPKRYFKGTMDLTLEIPVLDLTAGITGVPMKNGEWETDWLYNQVGWLYGSAFPGWSGNSYLAGHNFLPSGLPGPFEKIKTLSWGDEILIHVYGETLVYQVRSVKQVLANTDSVLTKEETPWLTLITCDQFDEELDSYQYRIIVKAVLVNVH